MRTRIKRSPGASELLGFRSLLEQIYRSRSFSAPGELRSHTHTFSQWEPVHLHRSLHRYQFSLGRSCTTEIFTLPERFALRPGSCQGNRSRVSGGGGRPRGNRFVRQWDQLSWHTLWPFTFSSFIFLECKHNLRGRSNHFIMSRTKATCL